MTCNALFLFAPRFCDFGVDVAQAWARLQTGPVKIHGFCTGSSKIRSRVAKGLGDLAGEMHELERLEPKWISSSPDRTSLAELEARYPPDTLRNTIIADRRIGRGYVINGLTPPSLIADTSLRDPERVPLAYVASLYAYIEECLDRLAPDLCFCYAVAGAPAYALSIVCARRGIPFLLPTPTRLRSRYLIDTDHQGLLREPWARYEIGADPTASAKENAQAYLHAFREKPQAPQYMDAVSENIRTAQTWSRVASLMRGSIQRAVGAWLTGSDEKKLKTRIGFFEARKIVRQKLGRRAERRRTTALPERFVYYPLHVSPEASTMVLAPHYTDQIAVIEALSKSLPAGMVLVVKDHLPMIGLRPSGFYERISAMPGVRLVSPFLQGLSLVQRAEVVAVITGTAAWEALLLKRPSVSLSKLQFHCIEGAGVVADGLEKFGDAIEKACKLPPVPDEDIIRYIATLMDESFDLPVHILWGDYGKADEVEKLSFSESLAGQIQRRFQAVQSQKSI